MKKMYKKFIAVILIFSVLLISRPAPAHADSWGSNMMAAIWKDTTERMYRSIENTILANLKIAAIRIVMAKLQMLLGGKNQKRIPGVAGFIINDWKMFIYASAFQLTNQVTNDFFNSLRSGTPGPLNQRVIMPAQKAVMFDPFSPSFRPNLQYYVAGGDASKIFTPGFSRNPWLAWMVAAQPQNDLAFTFLRGLDLRQSVFQQESEAKKAEGIAGQGIKGKETSSSAKGSPASAIKSGAMKANSQSKITTPGSIIANLINEINNMPMKMLALARTIPEVVTSMVNQVITQVIQQGVSKMIDPNYKQNSKLFGSYGSSMMGMGMPFGSFGSMGMGMPFGSFGSMGMGMPLGYPSLSQSQFLIQNGYGGSNFFFK